jgi:hypothetical protein
MKANFRIELFRDLIFEDRLIDLHNNFDFQGFEYNNLTHTLTLSWYKATDDWVGVDELAKVILIHREVSYLKIMPQDMDFHKGDEFCLAHVTFFPSSDRDSNELLSEQENPNEGDDMIYSFQNGQIIRVGSQEVIMVV